MPKVICTLPGASELINGVRFVTHALGVISEEIEDEIADLFTSIPGYKLASEIDHEIVALRARAAEIGMKFDARWKASRLKSEIEAFEAEIEEAEKLRKGDGSNAPGDTNPNGAA